MARLTNLTDRGYETQRQLRDTLMALIIEKGYERVSIKDITEKAGIDRTTFYLHFKDKDALFENCRHEMINGLVARRDLVEEYVIQNMRPSLQALFVQHGLIDAVPLEPISWIRPSATSCWT